MRLIADCGNSTVKLAIARDGGVWLHERLAPTAADLDRFLAAHPAAFAELVLLPGGRTAAAVRAWWMTVGAGRPCREVGRELPLPAVGQYPGFGLDRLVAGLAACAQEQDDVVVVDCGTATTLTAWRRAGPRLLGGLILPGARACIAGLAADAPALPVVEPLDASAPALQRDTAGAIAAAVGIGHPAMVAACLERVQRESGCAALVVTGGNATPLLGNALPRRAYRPSLVCEGVELLCRP
jgi:pantothenate kinase type III